MKKLTAVISRQNWTANFFVFGHFDQKTKNGINPTLESKTPSKNFTVFENDL